MIEASIGAVAGLLPAFFVLVAVAALPTALMARARKRPVVLPSLLAVSLAGVVAVTLLPGNAGSAMKGMCDTGWPTHLFTSSSALLNVALFVPVSLLTVLVFRRPVTVTSVMVLLSGAIEVVQATGSLGRSCSVTDIAANAVGALLGSVAGAVWLRSRGIRDARAIRDVCWGAGIGVIGAAALVGVLNASVKSVDIVSSENRRDAYVRSLDGVDEWITGAAESVFGAGVKSSGGTTMEKHGDRTLVTLNTDRGKISGWWPDRALDRAWTSDMRVDEGSLPERQVQESGDAFARKWFPSSVSGSRRTIDAMGDDESKVYVLTYRRYRQGVMMPMRLDITITGSGRMMGFASKPIPDPSLPPTAVSQDRAKELAKKLAGADADAAVLLAQKVGDNWRPVWMISVKSGSKDPNLFLDAVTGERVQPTV